MALRSLAGKLRSLLPARAATERAVASDLEKLYSKAPATTGSEHRYSAITRRMQEETRRSMEQGERYRRKQIMIQVGSVAFALGFTWLAISSVATALPDDDF